MKTNFGLDTFNVRIEDMNSFDEKLTTLLSEDPNRILPELEKGAQDAAESLSLQLKNIQLSFSWNSKPMGIRDLSVCENFFFFFTSCCKVKSCFKIDNFNWNCYKSIKNTK